LALICSLNNNFNSNFKRNRLNKSYKISQKIVQLHKTVFLKLINQP
jgi:hypothetical protein